MPLFVDRVFFWGWTFLFKTVIESDFFSTGVGRYHRIFVVQISVTEKRRGVPGVPNEKSVSNDLSPVFFGWEGAHWTLALHLLEDMSIISLVPDVVCYTAAINACEKGIWGSGNVVGSWHWQEDMLDCCFVGVCNHFSGLDIRYC